MKTDGYDHNALHDVFMEIAEKHEKNYDKWGQLDHKPVEWISILTEEVGEAAQEANQAHWEDNRDIQVIRLNRYRDELIDIGAVVIDMILCLERGDWWEGDEE